MDNLFERTMCGKSFRRISGILIFALLISSSIITDFGSPSFALAQQNPLAVDDSQNTGTPSADRDADGIPDDQDACPDDSANSCNLLIDTDSDSIPDDQDACPDDPTNSCNLPADTDGDGIPDDQDACLDDPTNSCNLPTDTDADGIPDDQDACPDDAANTCNLPIDTDGDGVPDDQDACPGDPVDQCASGTVVGSPAVVETPVSPGTPEAIVQPASVTFPPPPAELVRLPFAGEWPITGGPEIAACSQIPNHFHYQGGAPVNERAIDFGMPSGTPVYAAGAGRVVNIDGTFGQVDIEHASGLETHYLHLSQILVSQGDPVSAGTLIGFSGDTGSSGEFHLHFSATSSSGASVDIRGMTDLEWVKEIAWTPDGFIGNCAARVGMNEGSANGGDAPVTPPSTKTPTPAPGGFPTGSKVKTTSSNLNMRKGAGTGYGILYKLGSGTTCTVLAGPTAANGYQWYRLDCGSSRVGWVAGSYLKLVSSATATPVKTPTPKPTPPKSPTPNPTPTKSPGGFPAGSKVKTTTSNLKMRKGAGTNYGVLYTLGSGTTCTVLAGPTPGGSYQWYRLDCGSSRVGWIAGSYLKLVSSGTPTPTKTPTKTPTAPSTSMIGSFAEGQPVRVTTGNVKLRSGAGTGYSIVITLQAGNVCFVVGGPATTSGFQWYELYCSLADEKGWAAGSFLVPLSVQNEIVYTTTGNLKMRSGVGLSYSALYTLSDNTPCTVIGGPSYADGYQWYRLDCGSSRIGWVAGRFLILDIGAS